MKPPSHPLPTPSQPSFLLLGRGFCVYPFYICVLRGFDIWALLILERLPSRGWLFPRHSQQLTVGLSHANLSSISSLLHCPDSEPVWATTHPAPLMLGPGTRWLRKPLALHSPLTLFILAIQRLLSLPRLPFPEKWPSRSWPCFPLTRSVSWKTLGVPVWPGHRMTGCVSCF